MNFELNNLNQAKKIYFLLPGLTFGGAERVIFTLCNELDRSKFAPTLVSPNYDVDNLKAWNRAVAIALQTQRNWYAPHAQRNLVVPGADHFVVHALASPAWAKGAPVATIGDHTFYRVSRL